MFLCICTIKRKLWNLGALASIHVPAAVFVVNYLPEVSARDYGFANKKYSFAIVLLPFTNVFIPRFLY